MPSKRRDVRAQMSQLSLDDCIAFEESLQRAVKQNLIEDGEKAEAYLARARRDQREMEAAADRLVRDAYERLNSSVDPEEKAKASADLRYAREALKSVRMMGPGAWID